MAFYGAATLAFQVHIIKHLRLHCFACNGAGIFQKSVCQRAFAMVYMGYNAEITNVLHGYE